MALTSPIVDEMAGSGGSGISWNIVSLPLKLKRADQIRQTLEELGVPKEKIEDACGSLYARHRRDQVVRILTMLVNANRDPGSTWYSQLDFDSTKWNRTTLEELIKNNHLRTDENIREMILDLEYWDEHRKLRRLKEWESSL